MFSVLVGFLQSICFNLVVIIMRSIIGRCIPLVILSKTLLILCQNITFLKKLSNNVKSTHQVYFSEITSDGKHKTRSQFVFILPFVFLSIELVNNTDD